MKMKLTASLLFLLSAALSLYGPRYGPLVPFAFAIVFALYGIAASVAKGLDPLNDLPNALRVFLASLGGYLLTLGRVFLFPSLALMLLFASLYLNDEFQRRALDAVRRGRKGGSVALLGIDGSGKSTHSAALGPWLEGRGYRCALMPFHRYLFVERLARASSAVRGGRRRRGGNPLRPLLSLFDNLLLQLSSSIGCRVEGRVVVYDRFIWSTYIKYRALGYPVRPISSLYLLPRPTAALVLDVPVEKSLGVIDERVAHIRYPREVLQQEREEYLRIARRNGYPIIDATAPFEDVQDKIEAYLAGLFPVAEGRRGS